MSTADSPEPAAEQPTTDGAAAAVDDDATALLEHVSAEDLATAERVLTALAENRDALAHRRFRPLRKLGRCVSRAEIRSKYRAQVLTWRDGRACRATQRVHCALRTRARSSGCA